MVTKIPLASSNGFMILLSNMFKDRKRNIQAEGPKNVHQASEKEGKEKDEEKENVEKNELIEVKEIPEDIFNA